MAEFNQYYFTWASELSNTQSGGLVASSDHNFEDIKNFGKKAITQCYKQDFPEGSRQLWYSPSRNTFIISDISQIRAKEEENKRLYPFIHFYAYKYSDGEADISDFPPEEYLFTSEFPEKNYNYEVDLTLDSVFIEPQKSKIDDICTEYSISDKFKMSFFVNIFYDALFRENNRFCIINKNKQNNEMVEFSSKIMLFLHSFVPVSERHNVTYVSNIYGKYDMRLEFKVIFSNSEIAQTASNWKVFSFDDNEHFVSEKENLKSTEEYFSFKMSELFLNNLEEFKKTNLKIDEILPELSEEREKYKLLSICMYELYEDMDVSLKCLTDTVWYILKKNLCINERIYNGILKMTEKITVTEEEIYLFTEEITSSDKGHSEFSYKLMIHFICKLFENNNLTTLISKIRDFHNNEFAQELWKRLDTEEYADMIYGLPIEMENVNNTVEFEAAIQHPKYLREDYYKKKAAEKLIEFLISEKYTVNENGNNEKLEYFLNKLNVSNEYFENEVNNFAKNKIDVSFNNLNEINGFYGILKILRNYSKFDTDWYYNTYSEGVKEFLKIKHNSENFKKGLDLLLAISGILCERSDQKFDFMKPISDELKIKNGNAAYSKKDVDIMISSFEDFSENYNQVAKITNINLLIGDLYSNRNTKIVYSINRDNIKNSLDEIFENENSKFNGDDCKINLTKKIADYTETLYSYFDGFVKFYEYIDYHLKKIWGSNYFNYSANEHIKKLKRKLFVVFFENLYRKQESILTLNHILINYEYEKQNVTEALKNEFDKRDKYSEENQIYLEFMMRELEHNHVAYKNSEMNNYDELDLISNNFNKFQFKLRRSNIAYFDKAYVKIYFHSFFFFTKDIEKVQNEIDHWTNNINKSNNQIANFLDFLMYCYLFKGYYNNCNEEEKKLYNKFFENNENIKTTGTHLKRYLEDNYNTYKDITPFIKELENINKVYYDELKSLTKDNNDFQENKENEETDATEENLDNDIRPLQASSEIKTIMSEILEDFDSPSNGKIDDTENEDKNTVQINDDSEREKNRGEIPLISLIIFVSSLLTSSFLYIASKNTIIGYTSAFFVYMTLYFLYNAIRFEDKFPRWIYLILSSVSLIGTIIIIAVAFYSVLI